MAARAATFVIRREAIAKLAQSAAGTSGPSFTQVLTECVVEPGEGFGFKGYTLVFLLHYLEMRGIFLGSEYLAAEQTLNPVAAVGASIMTPGAFSSVDDLNPDRHDEKEIGTAVAQLGVDVPDAAVDGMTWLGILWQKVRSLHDDEALLILIG